MQMWNKHCTLWWTNILPWKITIFHGKIHYFYGHFQLGTTGAGAFRIEGFDDARELPSAWQVKESMVSPSCGVQWQFQQGQLSWIIRFWGNHTHTHIYICYSYYNTYIYIYAIIMSICIYIYMFTDGTWVKTRKTKVDPRHLEPESLGPCPWYCSSAHLYRRSPQVIMAWTHLIS